MEPAAALQEIKCFESWPGEFQKQLGADAVRMSFVKKIINLWANSAEGEFWFSNIQPVVGFGLPIKTLNLQFLATAESSTASAASAVNSAADDVVSLWRFPVSMGVF